MKLEMAPVQSPADGDRRTSAAEDRSATADDAALRADQRQAHAVQPGDPAIAAGPGTPRAERETRTARRAATITERADRDETRRARDPIATERDDLSASLDQRFHGLQEALGRVDPTLARELEALRRDAAADRARAAIDRDEAAQGCVDAANERARLEAELQMAHLDALTGTYRREMGLQALEHELARALRTGGLFVVAFVDVDELKAINDREGHAEGDLALQAVAATLRSRLRSFDPVVRYGGDEFVCAAGTSLVEASDRFAMIERELGDDAKIGISVGLAAFEAGETIEALIARADAAMLSVKRGRREAVSGASSRSTAGRSDGDRGEQESEPLNTPPREIERPSTVRGPVLASNLR
jgi:diguanylate cyclase (GGDEF)-like protein